MPLNGLSPAEQQRFEAGRRLFELEFTPATGLGPLWNGRACVECHALPEPGGVSRVVETHATRTVPRGPCDALDELGGPVYQARVTPALRRALGIDSEPIPLQATGRAIRRTPDVFGFGLLDAVPDETLLELADPNDADGDGISGRVNRFPDGRIGRFGRKAFVPTLAEFNEAALLFEQGITVPAFPDEGTIAGQPMPPGVDPLPEPELDAESVALIDDFVRFLAPPEPREIDGEAAFGEEIFLSIGCAACHVPALRTGDHEVDALANREVWAYTDLLLHDMGPENADICFGEATESEFRTEPLMGLRLPERYMHDGSARTIEEAIRKHDGEARRARDAYRRLLPVDRTALLEFLRRL
jgi:CxxC motif-containing protein (DUF1111 family)